MATRRAVAITLYMQPDGQEIVRISLAGGVHSVELNVEDYAFLKSRGLGTPYCCFVPPNNGGIGYVGISSIDKGRLVIAGRVLMLAGKGVCVHHIDRDPFNLRRDNLRLQAGRARRWDIALLPGLDIRGLKPAKLPPRCETPLAEAA